ncbi:MAG: S-adenosylmethionine:tRNA ribosyltransferase-isomerase [Rickettsiales bacterium]|jgi:S-adenosylmethionine:tRNA ribosyltransferase-isomerase|nr:S-adenosylmethionine:tRNA ribosyltransferase-isomerase [Rickettsiales bacterium]
MQVTAFDFDLPQEVIATRPLTPRDASRLLCVTHSGFQDKHVRDLTERLSPGDLFVFNDTKVIPARLFAMRAQAKIELTLHKPHPHSQHHWEAFARPAKRLAPGDTITIGEGFSARVEQKYPDGRILLSFDFKEGDIFTALERHGHMPLPPYIAKKRAEDKQDQGDYQTMFATHKGAVAAPTAGLHFTESLLKSLTDKGVRQARVTLHVGGGTFLPVKVEDTKDHVMHSEWCTVPEATVQAIHETKAAGGRVVAVGTTSLRALESAARQTGKIEAFTGDTDIFITPGYHFNVVDMLMTNFHLPKSTLFMLVCAFSGTKRMREAYAHAIATGYRFYSYGDACLLERFDEREAA